MGLRSNDQEIRKMVPRYADTRPATIKEFGCSGCAWTFYIQHPVPGPIRAELLEFAENAFDLHACSGGTGLASNYRAVDARKCGLPPSLKDQDNQPVN